MELQMMRVVSKSTDKMVWRVPVEVGEKEKDWGAGGETDGMMSVTWRWSVANSGRTELTRRPPPLYLGIWQRSEYEI